MARAARLVPLTVLALALSACQLKAGLSTTINGDGSGVFAFAFFVDAELAGLARQASEGRDPFEELSRLPEALGQAGWDFSRSDEGGGLRLTVRRAFRSCAELNGALAELAARTRAARSPAAASFFREFSCEHSRSFLRSRAGIRGLVDLSLGGLLQGSLIEDSGVTLDQIRQFVEQADVFDFEVRAELPGSVRRTEGSPDEVRGGTVVWSPRLGESLRFAAESSGFNAGALAAVVAPGVAVLALGLLALTRRRRPPAERDAG